MSLMGSKSTRRNYGKMRSAVTAVARERIDLLLGLAVEILPRDTNLAKRYVGLARKISTRTKVRIPREKKHYLCKNCGQPLVPGKNARIRLRSGNSRIIISCLSCGTFRRYPFRKPGLLPQFSMKPYITLPSPSRRKSRTN
jgi:ribonuclease P protein subunit RPR2